MPGIPTYILHEVHSYSDLPEVEDRCREEIVEAQRTSIVPVPATRQGGFEEKVSRSTHISNLVLLRSIILL
jgi:hypothetical protein